MFCLEYSSHPSIFSPCKKKKKSLKIICAAVEHLSICRGVHLLPEGETRVEDSLFSCEGGKPRTNDCGLTLQYEVQVHLCLHTSIPHRCKRGPGIPLSLLGISIKSWGWSPRKCLKWLESFLTIWKWKSAVTNSSPATKPLPPRLCIALFVPSSSPAFANSWQWKQWSSLAWNTRNARAVCDCCSDRHPPVRVSNLGRSD